MIYKIALYLSWILLQQLQILWLWRTTCSWMDSNILPRLNRSKKNCIGDTRLDKILCFCLFDELSRTNTNHDVQTAELSSLVACKECDYYKVPEGNPNCMKLKKQQNIRKNRSNQFFNHIGSFLIEILGTFA